jgi:hypothetical protein
VKLRHQLELSAKPWDVTVIDQSMAAVTLPSKKSIQFISLTDELSTTHTIDVQAACHGITYVASKLAVICDPCSGHASVKVLSMDGQVRHSITTDHVGRSLQEPYYITSTPGLTRGTPKLYVTDRSANNVLCFLLDGQCLFQYHSRDFSKPNELMWTWKEIYTSSVGKPRPLFRCWRMARREEYF